MWSRVLLLLSLLLMFSCSSNKRQRIVSVRNHNSSYCHLPRIIDDPSDFLRIGRRKSLMVVDANGFTVPYQRLDSGKIIFMADIPAAVAKKYTFKATRLKMDFPSPLKVSVEKNGDVTWANQYTRFSIHSSKIGGVGGGFGYLPDISHNSFRYGNTLGLGGIAPVAGDHLVRYGNFVKMELLDSGPVLMRMRFTFPEFSLDGRKIHEERTVSIVPNTIFSRVESRFIGSDSISLAIAMPYMDKDGLPSAGEEGSNIRYTPVLHASRGYMYYAQEGASEKHGTIYSGVIVDRKYYCNRLYTDGHFMLTTEIGPNETIVYYIGAASSYSGMNLMMWSTYIENLAQNLRSEPVVLSYDVE